MLASHVVDSHISGEKELSGHMPQVWRVGCKYLELVNVEDFKSIPVGFFSCFGFHVISWINNTGR